MTEKEANARGWRLERAPQTDEEGCDPWEGKQPPLLWISDRTGLPLPGGATVEEALAELATVIGAEKGAARVSVLLIEPVTEQRARITVTAESLAAAWHLLPIERGTGLAGQPVFGTWRGWRLAGLPDEGDS